VRLSTRSRYGLRAMITIAREKHGPLSAEYIAKDEGVSKKYLDGILGSLRQARLLKSHRGQGGGYSLTRPAEEINVNDIVEALERNIDIVRCVKDPDYCEKIVDCQARDVWRALSEAISETLSRITLAELIEHEAGHPL